MPDHAGTRHFLIDSADAAFTQPGAVLPVDALNVFEEPIVHAAKQWAQLQPFAILEAMRCL